MQRLDPDLKIIPAHSESARALREAAERYWRHAENTSEPERYRRVAMEYHARALVIEARLMGVAS
jgi:hypothetical protein